MTAPPVRRLVATAGLLVLAPVGLMLALGALSPEDAAVRAVATLGVCMVVGRALTAGLRSLLPPPPTPDRAQAARAGAAAERDGSGPSDQPSDQRGNASSAASTTIGSNAEPAS